MVGDEHRREPCVLSSACDGRDGVAGDEVRAGVDAVCRQSQGDLHRQVCCTRTQRVPV